MDAMSLCACGWAFSRDRLLYAWSAAKNDGGCVCPCVYPQSSSCPYVLVSELPELIEYAYQLGYHVDSQLSYTLQQSGASVRPLLCVLKGMI